MSDCALIQAEDSLLATASYLKLFMLRHFCASKHKSIKFTMNNAIGHLFSSDCLTYDNYDQ